jgi:phospholipid-translocating ATPase
MGIILMDTETGKILFFMKGADVAMIPIVEFSDWLDEECGNLARKGLRTLVNGMKILSKEEYAGFSHRLPHQCVRRHRSLVVKKIPVIAVSGGQV